MSASKKQLWINHNFLPWDISIDYDNGSDAGTKEVSSKIKLEVKHIQKYNQSDYIMLENCFDITPC